MLTLTQINAVLVQQRVSMVHHPEAYYKPDNKEARDCPSQHLYSFRCLCGKANPTRSWIPQYGQTVIIANATGILRQYEADFLNVIRNPPRRISRSTSQSASSFYNPNYSNFAQLDYAIAYINLLKAATNPSHSISRIVPEETYTSIMDLMRLAKKRSLSPQEPTRPTKTAKLTEWERYDD